MPISATVVDRARPGMAVGEIFSFAYDTFCASKVRFILTALGMVIGTASLILVVTIGMTGRQYVLNQIQAIGTNEIWAEHPISGHSDSAPDPLTLDDVNAVLRSVPGVAAASPVLDLHERIPVGSGQEKDILVLGVYPDYLRVRNLVLPSGRFFDQEDSEAHNKVGVITDKMAVALYGSPQEAVGKIIKLTGLPFTIIGTFRERVDTFGQSEIVDNTLLIPYSVSRYFTETPSLKMAYFSMEDPSMVIPATAQILHVLQSRHRAESVYSVQNLTALLAMADRIAIGLTIVLLAVSLVVLLVSGIGIMNIMLATVSARIREIGIRKAMGATNREIRFQFLSEAVLISLIGGVIGIVIGLAIPFSVRFFTEYRIPISGLSAIIAIVVSSLVGILFGTVPAIRASQLDPVESLRYE
ncbi:MAG TPA: ABC transporter permease [Terriglobales bacterium]|jgi:putative ABC transport system permease protein|nr:ABC transporter permease [Terriglobales bacterium]